ncbi:uncharacterized protein LOC129752026 [Uranotaenia lowii]|uniref:uncharacterized protein LOC129752026 n=1 Tax=Uranotaenia lowii TaxID=190385 RepID=UPI002478C694|nr:uncharacterized protein LOC129752026 [Uranotaenia lowii]
MPGEKLNEFLRKREYLFASLTRLGHFLVNFDPLNHGGQIQSRLEKLDAMWNEFLALQIEIQILDKNNDLARDSFETSERFENQYFEFRAALLANLPVPPRQVSNADHTLARNNTTLGMHSGVRLPQISIPSFDGDYRNWLAFKATFESLIHEVDDLSEVQKFHYLKSALKGEAAKLIESLTVTNENYLIAWETISKRYSNEKLLKKRHLQALMEYPRIDKPTASAIHGLVDEFEQRLKILKQLGEKVDDWGAMIVFWMCNKLDVSTLQLWEDHSASLENPSFKDLVNFLERRTRVLEAVSSNSSDFSSIQPRSNFKRNPVGVHVGAEDAKQQLTCVCCGQSHYMSQCERFIKMSLKEKLDFINTKRLCSSCLKGGHWARNCNSKFRCRTCNQKHHSFIHPGFSNVEERSTVNSAMAPCSSHSLENDQQNVENPVEAEERVGSFSAEVKAGSSCVFLSTVMLTVKDYSGAKHMVRALLDNGSQANIISERLCQVLKLKRRAINVPICGVGQAETRARHSVRATIGSRVKDFSIGMDFLVLQRVTTNLPSRTVPVKHWKIPERYNLADPEFNVSHRIDLLVGAENFYDFLYQNELKRIPLGPGLPFLVDTVFGWVVSGKAMVPSETPVACNVAVASDGLERQLERFWIVESNDEKPVWTLEEINTEEHFVKHHSRDQSGRYIVRLPKHLNFERMLGGSQVSALERFRKLERRLARDSELKRQYHDFMKEYLELKHMRKVPEDELATTSSGNNKRKVYYLPHHPVVKESSTTTKVRVVFDGSARTDSGYSLNDCLMKGPIIQEDLLSLLLRFRKHEIALVGDVEKMYRQVLLHSDDTPLQRIFWRFSETEPIDVYELLTVTYGLTPSSFLATRCLTQLAADVGSRYTRASKALVNDFYVDDCISGATTIDEAIVLRDELVAAMKEAGFCLRKICSNRPEVLADLSGDQLGTNLTITFDFSPGEEVKTLGITWDPYADDLRFLHNISAEHITWTRRHILSAIAKLFDPLGLIAPVVVSAKIIMQELALLQTKWDEPVPQTIDQKWKIYYDQIPKLSELRISRFAFTSGYTDVQLHCFADASERAYGACIYVRSTDAHGAVRVEILSAKSRVAPLKRLTLPRLELCAAKEAANLYSRVVKALSLDSVEAHFWSDSTVVLHWLKAQPNTWNTFVANRVSSIQTRTYGHQWHHIAGKENPADLVSRGLPVADFLESELWRVGPKWLQEAEDVWPMPMEEITIDDEDLEMRKTVCSISTAPEPHRLFLLSSSFTTSIRIVAFCFRFVHYFKHRNQQERTLLLTAEEFRKAKIALTRLAQSEIYAEEVKQLRKNHQVSSNSPLKLLSPFLDQEGVIRVGGRLRNSLEQYDVKHPAVIPPSHPFTNMAIDYFHQKTIHGSHKLTLSALRQEFWPIHGKRAVKQVLRKCHFCFRVNPKPYLQPMGQLPSTRVRPSRPFHITGVDYCGPFYLKPPHRRASPPKCFIAVFICFSTKALHLELVGDLTTSSFISALRRFVGYHGVPAEIHSDNAKNFIGAKHELRKLYDILHQRQSHEAIANELSQQSIEWRFIPPRAPNFGGLWEAAVRNVKTSLKRSIGLHQLSHEDFHTLLVQITSALNSRPLSPLTDDPSDVDALTPSHFLIGCPMTDLPEKDFRSVPTNRLTHYQQRQQLFQHYWQRWSREYLTELQTSSASCRRSPIRVGSIVVLREDNVPPLCWPLARIIAVHPGHDNIVRVVTIKTATGIYKRSVYRLCPLPAEESDTNKRILEDNEA